MVPASKGSRLSLYCSGTGSPTVVLETGFGGGTAATWYKLQPLLSELTRTCSYDRAGYGFSTLGSNLPRDLHHALADLHRLLANSGEKSPYILAGHSNGGLLIGAFADRYPTEVAGLIFLDSAVALPSDPPMRAASPLDEYSHHHLDTIRRCLERARHGLAAGPGDECVDPKWYDSFPPELAPAEIANRSKLDFWRAYLSEAECNYAGQISGQARAFLPHRWRDLPVRVFSASVGAMSDADASVAFGIPETDRKALAEARSNRAGGEKRQEQLCSFSSDCQVTRVPTTDHLVHNAAPDRVVAAVAGLVKRSRHIAP